MEKIDEIEKDLEQCVNLLHAQIDIIPECRDCAGYDFNCSSYYPIKDIYKLKTGGELK